MSEPEQLKPCAFCGGQETEVRNTIPGSAFDKTYTLIHWCVRNDKTQAWLQFTGDTKQEAIDKWNTRAISLDEKEQLRRLKAFVNELIDKSENEWVDVDQMIMAHKLQENDGMRDGHPNFKKAAWLKD